jgi:hypothetical protein
MPLAALIAAMIVGIRITATMTPPRSIAARPGLHPFASSFSCNGLKQIARMIVHKSNPTNGSRSCTQSAISKPVKKSGSKRSIQSLTDLVPPGAVAIAVPLAREVRHHD